MQSNRGPRSSPITRGGRGTGRGRQIQQAETGAPASRSVVAVRPNRGVTRNPGNSDLRSMASPGQARASILQSASRVGIRGGNFTTVGTNQLNFTFNLGDESRTHDLAQSASYNESHPSDNPQRNDSTRDVPAERSIPAGSSSSHLISNPTPRRSYDIYYQHIGAKGRGSALWIPEPSRSLHIDYRRRGISIGDVGIITEFGGFDFLFNICLAHDDPINPPDLPENFTTLSIPAIDIHRYSEFMGESYLSSASISKSFREGDPSGQAFESSASEGAILTMPVGSNSEDLRVKSGIRTYVSTHGENWYKYANNVRGREVENGDIRLVVGFDKTTAWGMATFSHSTVQNDLFRLKFRPMDQNNIPRTYGWEYSGSAETRTGPDVRQVSALRGSDPSQAELEYENQTLFVRTMNVTLQKDIWTKLGFNFGQEEVDIEDSPTASRHSDSISPPRGRPVSGTHSSFQSGSQPSSRAVFAGNTDKTPMAVVTSALPTSLTGHPSKGINEMLLQLYPKARMAITEDDDWISVLTSADSTLPTIEELNQRIRASFTLGEEEDITFLEKKKLDEPPSALFAGVDESDTFHSFPLPQPSDSVYFSTMDPLINSSFLNLELPMIDYLDSPRSDFDGSLFLDDHSSSSTPFGFASELSQISGPVPTSLLDLPSAQPPSYYFLFNDDHDDHSSSSSTPFGFASESPISSPFLTSLLIFPSAEQPTSSSPPLTYNFDSPRSVFGGSLSDDDHDDHLSSSSTPFRSASAPPISTSSAHSKDASFSTFSAQWSHPEGGREDSERRYTCPQPGCDEAYLHPSGLRYHVKYDHPPDLPAQSSAVPPALELQSSTKARKTTDNIAF